MPGEPNASEASSASLVPDSGSPEILQITVDSTCQGCAISAEHVATLGAVEDPTSPWTFTTVVRDTTGHFYVAPTMVSHEIAVYGPTGGFLRTLGRGGEGPGEFEGIRALKITGGDTLHVFSSGRHTVMSTTTGEVFSVGSLVNHGREFHVFEDGRVLQDQTNITPGVTAAPVHLYESDGRKVRSFGLPSTDSQEIRDTGMQRSVSFTEAGEIWINPYGHFRLELWDTTGTHLKTLVRDSPWLTPWTSDEPGAPYRTKPNARVLGVHEDREGRLWVHGRVPDRNWQPGPPSGFYEDVYDSILEVIDPATGKLLTSRTFDGADQLFFGFISYDLIFAIREGDFGVSLIDVWRVWFHRPEQRRVP